MYKKEISIPFYCMFYPGTCNESLIETMRDAGLSGVWLGVQSGSQRVREQIFKRKYTNDDVIKQASIFNRHGISVKYDFILDNPFETEVELSQTYELMKHLPTPKKFNFFSLKFFPKTKITQMAIEKNVISENDICSNVYIDLFNYVISKQREEEIYRSIGITQ